MALFTRHIDKNKEGMEWGIYFTLTDMIGAVLSMLGGYIAAVHGFEVLIMAIVGVSLIGVSLLWPIRLHLQDTASSIAS